MTYPVFHADAPLYPAYGRLFEEAGKPRGGGEPALRAMQFRATASLYPKYTAMAAGVSDTLWTLQELVEQTSR
jgi:hypothetical protein